MIRPLHKLRPLEGCAIAASTVGVYLFLANLLVDRRERRYLDATLGEIVGPNGIRTREDLVNLKRFLTTRIDTDPARTHEPRPLLRASASDTLERRFGFCGESARTAILLLGAGGVRAHRVYIEGERWGHVAVEQEWEGRWVLFDAHDDPSTVLPDALVGNVPSDQLDQFPNSHQRNPYRRAYRIKLFRNMGPLSRWSNVRPPAWIARSAERPALIKAVTGALLTGVGVAGLLRTRMTRSRPS